MLGAHIECVAYLVITFKSDWPRERCGLSQYLSYDMQVSQIARVSFFLNSSSEIEIWYSMLFLTWLSCENFPLFLWFK